MAKPKVLAFDVYGTLIDTQGIVDKLTLVVGDQAAQFSRLWRDKQLEYSFRRGLMRAYQGFDLCTEQALDYACLAYSVTLSDSQKADLLEGYRHLPAFPDVSSSLRELANTGLDMYAFSNGLPDSVESLLAEAQIGEYFLGVVSVDEIQSFKPDPAVYKLFCAKAGCDACEAMLISSNPFDILGALHAGMQTAWVQRSPDAIFDPWTITPGLTVTSLGSLPDLI